MRFGSRLGPISNQFWNQFGVPKLPQKWSEKSFFLVTFLKPFVWGLEALQVPLGSLPEPLMLILAASKTRKVWFFIVKQHFWKMILFGALKLFMALLGPSWLLLGPIWSQNGLENGPRTYPKVVPKIVQKTAPQKMNFKTILGSNLGPSWAKKSRAHFAPASPFQLQIS